MNHSIVDSLVQELVALLSPLSRAVESPTALADLFTDLGLVDPEGLGVLAPFVAVRDLRAQIEALAAQDDLTLDTLETALDISRSAIDIARSLDDAESPLPELQNFGRDLVDVLLAAWLAGRHPVAREIAVLLTLLDVGEDAAETPAQTRDGEVVRLPFRVDRLRLDRLPALLRDPVAVLRAEYVNDLATDADAAAMAARLFPRVVGLLRVLGVSCRYGVLPEDESALGEAAPLVRHALIVYAKDLLQGADEEAGVVVTISPASRGDLGLVFSPFGALSFAKQVGRWTVTSTVSGQVDVLAWGRHALTLLASSEDAKLEAELVAEIQRREDQPAYRLGAPDGTRLELGDVRIASAALVSQADPTLAVSVDCPGSALVLAPSGAGVLASLLPRGGLRADFDLGLAWSSQSGLTLSGSASLDTTLPTHVSVGGLTLSALHLALRPQQDRVTAEVSASVALALGPVRAMADRIGVSAVLTFPQASANLGAADLALAFKPPSSIGLGMSTPVVSISGAIGHDAAREQYAGAIEVRLANKLDIRAFAIVTAGQAGFSLFVLLGTRFAKPIHLGYNVYLAGVGGLLGLHRTADVDRMRRGLRDGSAAEILFPKDVIANAQSLISDLAQMFPRKRDQFLIGPTAQLTWNVPTLISADVGLVLELGSPTRVLLLGGLRAAVPKPEEPILDLKVAFLGAVDFDKGLLSFDASVYDSYIGRGAFKFGFEGDLAFRASWGKQKDLVASVGGFHPEYKPAAYLQIPQLKRVTVSLLKDNPKLTLAAYFALTSNTVQFGAELDFLFKVKSFKVVGNFGFDAIFQFSPFKFAADARARVAVMKGSRSLFSISLAFELSGTTPWVAKGKASFKILFFTVSVRFEKTWGEKREISQPKVAVLPEVRTEFERPTNWLSELGKGTAQGALLAEGSQSALASMLDPAGTLTIRQTLVPLGSDFSRFGNSGVSDVSRVDIQAVKVGPLGNRVDLQLHEVYDGFAPAAFREMSDRDKLKATSFESQKSGVAARAAQGFQSNFLLARPVSYERIISDGTERKVPPAPIASERFQRLVPGGAIGRSSGSRQRALERQENSVRAIGRSEERFSVVHVDTLRPVDDASRSLTRAQAESRMRELDAAAHDIVPSYLAS